MAVDAQGLRLLLVALFTGAWIETANAISFFHRISGRALYGRVD